MQCESFHLSKIFLKDTLFVPNYIYICLRKKYNGL